MGSGVKHSTVCSKAFMVTHNTTWDPRNTFHEIKMLL